jgi:nucleotide-binding universal stress UspA family protein
MYRILVPVDGSDVALRALDYAVRLVRLIGEGEAEIHLVNVQPPMTGSVGAFVGSENVARFLQEESDNAMAGARQLLEREGLPVHAVMRVGSAGEAIAVHARELPCDEIVMGTRGLGRIGSLVLGSVATQVVHLAECPVTLIK